MARNDKILCWCFAIMALAVIIANFAFASINPTPNCYISVADGSAVDMSSCTSGVLFPVGNTAARPSSPVLGVARINSDTTMQEVYNGSSWTLFPLTKTYTNNPSHTIQTVAAAANGFQLSTNRDANVSYSVSISTTATIGGASTGYVVLEEALTNSVNAGDWQEVARLTNSQNITLALALQSIQVVGGTLSGVIPAGYYARLRSVSSSGTPTFAYVSGQEVY